jgi:hypothetical protein
VCHKVFSLPYQNKFSHKKNMLFSHQPHATVFFSCTINNINSIFPHYHQNATRSSSSAN